MPAATEAEWTGQAGQADQGQGAGAGAGAALVIEFGPNYREREGGELVLKGNPAVNIPEDGGSARSTKI